MVELNLSRPWIMNAVKYFQKDPTFHKARNIWLHCQENGLLVPPVVNEFFIKRLTDDNNKWLDRIGGTLEKEMSSGIFDNQIVEQREAGRTYRQIAYWANGSTNRGYWTAEKIRNRYRKRSLADSG